MSTHRTVRAAAIVSFYLLISAGATLGQEAAPSPARVATVKVIMSGIHQPHCGAIAALLKGEGPKDEKAWAELAMHAALLNESGHLLVENNRCPDGVWADAAAKLRDGTSGVFAAAGRKDLKAAQEAFANVTASCAACHAKHKQPAPQAAASPAPAPAATSDKPAKPQKPKAADAKAKAAKPDQAAAAKPPADANGQAAKPAAQPRIAQIRHLMAGINGPTCSTLGGLLKGEGPKEPKDWDEVIRHAALLNEVGFLLMENNRCPDDVWKNACASLRESSGRVAIAGGSKNLEEARTGFQGITTACGACHAVHKKPPA